MSTGYNKGTYIIGTGWHCDGKGRIKNTPSAGKAGDFNRSREFFNLWYYFVNKYTQPQKIIIIDSNSPIKPMMPKDDRIEILNMKKNFGAPCHKQGIWTGGERAFMLGCFYALMNDVEYFIYIEQDCLVRGKEWLELVLKNMQNHKISFGLWDPKNPSSYGSEWSLCVIRTDYILEWLNNYIHLDRTKFIRSEIKFTHLRTKNKADFKELPFGYGRIRPIDFTKKHFYAQQWTDEEINKMLALEGKKPRR